MKFFNHEDSQYNTPATNSYNIVIFSPDTSQLVRHADLCVPQFLIAITSAVHPTQSVKISTLYHNFLIYSCRDVSLILHICTKLQIDSHVGVSGLKLSQLLFSEFFK